MDTILAFTFDAQRSLMKIVVTLFVFNAIGYFVRAWIVG
jgi:hypothetical protein